MLAGPGGVPRPPASKPKTCSTGERSAVRRFGVARSQVPARARTRGKELPPMSKEGSVAPKERVNITYKPATGNAKEEVELPLKLLMIGDYTCRPDPRP